MEKFQLVETWLVIDHYESFQSKSGLQNAKRNFVRQDLNQNRFIYWSENLIYTKNSANTILLTILIWYKELIWVKEYMKK